MEQLYGHFFIYIFYPRTTAQEIFSKIVAKIVAKKFKLYKNLIKRKFKYIDITKKNMQVHKVLECHFINKKKIYRN